MARPRKYNMKLERVSLCLTVENHARLKKLAAKNNTSLSQLVNNIINTLYMKEQRRQEIEVQRELEDVLFV